MSKTPTWEELHGQRRFRPTYPSESVVRFVARHLGYTTADPTPRARVLDHGCGAGRHLKLVAEHGHLAIGVDRSIVGLKEARIQLGEADVLMSDMHALPFPSEAFDAAISYGVVLYNTAGGIRRSIEEIRRTLRTGAPLLVVTRTVDDARFSMGERLEERTVRLTSNDTNEGGMVMHFLDRDAIDEVFADFSDVSVDRIDHTAGGGSLVNSDWVIEARR